METQAYFLVRYGKAEQAFECRTVALSPLRAGELCIEVESFGLNYADVMARNKLYREAPPLPAVLGYEVVGKVIQAADEANQNWIGKRIVAFTRFGGYSKHVNSPVHACAEIGEMPANQALALATQYVTAYYMAVYLTPLHRGERVLIHAAAGGVGIALIQLAQLHGAEVFAKLGSDSKKEFVQKLGVNHVVNYKKTDYASEVLKQLEGKRLDVVYNPVGGSTLKKDMKLLGSGGRIMLFGGSELLGKKWGILSTLNFVRKMGFIIPIGLMMRSKSILGINMLKIADFHPHILQHCLQEVVRLTMEGKLNPPKGKDYPHQQIAQAHSALEKGESIGKISISWD